jgi:hypothetical protein
MRKRSKLFWAIDEMNGLNSLFQIYKKETLVSPSLSLGARDSLFSSLISLHDSRFLFPESSSTGSPPQLLLIKPSLVFVIHRSMSSGTPAVPDLSRKSQWPVTFWQRYRSCPDLTSSLCILLLPSIRITIPMIPSIIF